MRVPEPTIAIAERLQKLADDLAAAKEAVEARRAEAKVAEDNLKRAVTKAETAEADIQTEVRKLCGVARQDAVAIPS
jgi:predicted  nucleic acid-binding Zn-ribbon protein